MYQKFCNDNNACTFDTCFLPQGCDFIALTCDDGNNCTIDTCNSTTGCIHTQMSCDDGNACTADSCKNGYCIHTPIPIPPSNFCNGTYCNPNVGIVFIPTQCPAACTGCDPNNGCVGCPGAFGTVAAVATGIGAGIIVAIVIGAIVAIVLGVLGGKKGYDMYMKYHQNLEAAQENPLYNDGGLSGVNPLAED